MGFEPTRHVSTPTPLAGERLQPLGHLSGSSHLERIPNQNKREDCIGFNAIA